MAKKFDAKAKAKRQKIIAAVLGVVLLAVMAYEVPPLLKSKKAESVPAASPVPVTPPAAAGTPLASTATGSSVLVDSDPAPALGNGQLFSFDRFDNKDPFVQQIGAACDPDPTGNTASTCTKTASKQETPAAPPPPPASSTKATPQPAPTVEKPTSAKISVNGATEAVAVSQTFPKADPVFVLVSVTKTTAKVGVSGGSLDSGRSTVTLTKGKKLTLMNTADGTRYVLLLVSVS